MKGAGWSDQWKSASGGDLPPMIRCPDCYLEMPKDAQKCYKCGYMRRRSWLSSINATTLSLLIALFSVILTGLTSVPAFRELLIPSIAKPQAAFLTANADGTIEISTLNSGRETAVLRDGEITISKDNNVLMLMALYFPKTLNISEFRTLKSQDFRTILATTQDQNTIKQMKEGGLMREDPKVYECRVQLHFISLSKTANTSNEIDCTRLHLLWSFLLGPDSVGNW